MKAYSPGREGGDGFTEEIYYQPFNKDDGSSVALRRIHEGIYTKEKKTYNNWYCVTMTFLSILLVINLR